MLIEEPDKPLSFPVRTEMFALLEQEFQTIGDFYRDLRAKLKPEWFTGNPSRQVSSFVDPVYALADAQRAIDTIVVQGEGTDTSPIGTSSGVLAHYYRFKEIAQQLTLNPDPSSPNGFSFGPPGVPFDPLGVLPIVQDPASSLYPPGSQVRVESDRFNQIYSNLLRALQAAFNGAPDQLAAAIGLMTDLKKQAITLVNMPLGNGNNGAPCFEWVAT